MDRLTKDRRSAVMSTVRRQGTRLEAAFGQGLAERGLTGFEEQAAGVPGHPDFVHREARVAIFIDSCFWHGCPSHLRRPSSNMEYWRHKVARNRARDRRVSAELKAAGWRVVRIWEHSVRNPRALKWWLTRIEHLVAERPAP
jgi:DNA mismatch endonuclease (patch repair protein)